MGIKLTLLNCGLLDADRSVIHPGDDSYRRVLLPIPALLIQSEGRSILIDSGNPLVAAGNPQGLEQAYGTDPAWIRPMVAANQRIDEQLRLLGLRIEDLDLVINTHLHFDHAGGNAVFAARQSIAVQTAELQEVRINTESYMPVWDAPGLQFQAVEGDWSPLPGIEMLLTPGHTPGHQSLLIRLAERPWLFTVDAVYTEEHWREDKLGAVADVATARASLERLRQIAQQENARLVFGHDLAQWESFGMSPDSGPTVLVEDT